MKTRIAPVILLSLLMAFTPSCGTTPKKVAHTTLEAVGLSVQKAMQAAAAGVKAGKVTPDEWQQITKVHDTKYLPAYRTACDIAASNFDALAPADLLNIQLQLLTLINQLSQ